MTTAGPVLTLQIATQFLQDDSTFDLNVFSSVEADALKLLAARRGALSLNGVTQLSDAMARILSFHDGWLNLDGLRELSVHHALQLATKSGTLSLCGLCRITEHTAEALSRHEFGMLILDGLADLPDDIAIWLSNHKGFLHLSGLTTLAVSTAKALANHKDGVKLGGIKEITAEVASAFAKHEGALSLGITHLNKDVAKSLAKRTATLFLDGLQQIDAEVAGLLAKHQGDLFLDGLSALTDDAAEKLATHRGGLSLATLFNISDEAAANLARQRGDLNLTGLTVLSDKAATALARCRGNLCLDGLKEMSEGVAKRLAKHKGELTLDGLTHIPEGPAKLLGTFRCERLSLGGLSELSDVVAKSLVNYSGFLYLSGVASLSETAGMALSLRDGGTNLNGLTEISDAVGLTLSRCKGSLILYGLKAMSDQVREALAAKKQRDLEAKLAKKDHGSLAVETDVVAEETRSLGTVEALWSDFDPRKECLDVRIVREWENEEIVFRYVTYHIGSYKGKPSRMAGFFVFPKGAKKLPGLLYLNDGEHYGIFSVAKNYAKRGYACLSINWGGRKMENAEEGDPNTDWGAVDPTQQSRWDSWGLHPNDKSLDPFVSPRNSNWYLLTLGARRALTFLEEQAEVDGDRLGVSGHSAGGNLTVYVASTDGRVNAAVPLLGGSGFDSEYGPRFPAYKRRYVFGGNERFAATIGTESYTPSLKGPLLWVGATNDPDSVMDDTYRTGALIPHNDVRYSFTAHKSESLSVWNSVTNLLWFEQYLKGSFIFPKTPDSKLLFSAADHVPEFQVTPDSLQTLADVHIYYSVDPDPPARFWRSVEVTKVRDTWIGKLPVLAVKQPLFVFANVVYRLTKDEVESFVVQTDKFAISTMLHTATPMELRQANVQVTDSTHPLIDDFSHGWQDWYPPTSIHPQTWAYSTRKVGDPKWQGEPGERLAIEVQADRPNEMVIVLTENFWRSFRGKQNEFVAVVKLKGGEGTQSVSLSPKEFKTIEGAALSSWKNVDILSLRAFFDEGRKSFGSKRWAGGKPTFRKLWWQGNDRQGGTASESSVKQ